MSRNLPCSPHIHSGASISKTMRDVLIALLAPLAAGVIVFGLRALIVALVTTAAAVAAEALWCAVLRRRQTVTDGSAAVTGLLLALTLPASVPYWQAALGSVFAVLVVKCLFGGLGQNIFNPALAGRALLMLLFPSSLVRFAAPGSELPLTGPVDIVSSSTPLHDMVMPALPDASLTQMLLGTIGGCIGETSAVAILIGAAYLLVRGVIAPRIPLAYLGTVAVLTLVFSRGQDPVQWMLYSVLGGGVMLAAWFMATDYVTSPVTPAAQIVYGVAIGALTVFLRYTGLYPEGVTYAVLMMNAAVWALERALPRRRYGAAGKEART